MSHHEHEDCCEVCRKALSICEKMLQDANEILKLEREILSRLPAPKKLVLVLTPNK